MSDSIKISIYTTSGDAVDYELSKEEVNLMGTVKSIIEDVEDTTDEAIPLNYPMLTPFIMDFIKGYMEQFLEPTNEKVTYGDRSKDNLNNIPEWITEFFENIDREVLLCLANSANFLDFVPLTKDVCKIFALRNIDKKDKEINEYCYYSDDPKTLEKYEREIMKYLRQKEQDHMEQMEDDVMDTTD